MPLPLFDINQAMKGAWEAGSSNEKLLQIIRDIETCIFRNASARFSSTPPLAPPFRPTPPPAPPTPQAVEVPEVTPSVGPEVTEDVEDVEDVTQMTAGSSPGDKGLEGEEEEEEEEGWAWNIMGNEEPSAPT